MADLPDHVAENRRMWDEYAPEWVASGERNWASEPEWGVWGIPDAELPLMPPDLDGKRVIELGCGTGYVSAWMHRRGARVYAIDNSEQQLATARRLAAEHDITDIEWVHGDAERVPQPDGSFDVAISEYGAAIWCDPFVWIPEAHRLLGPGGLLTFFGNHPLATVCSSPAGDGPVSERLQRPYFGLHEADWTEAVVDPGGIEFNLPISDWLRLFRDTGFEVLDYIEVQAPEWATGQQFEAPAEWAKRWPAEQAWKLQKRE